MELTLVLFFFGILFFAMEKILINTVKIFENREKYPTKAKIFDIEYREKSKTTIYHVEFRDKEGAALKGKSLQYKGAPRFKIEDIVDIDYLIRDEMQNLIENNLIDVKHPDHKTMSEELRNPIRYMFYISIVFFVASIFALIHWVIF